MIKTNKGNVKAKGHIHELLADIGTAVCAVYNESLLTHYPEDRAKEMIRDAVELALMTDEERAVHMAKKLAEAIRDVFSDEEDEEESEGEEE